MIRALLAFAALIGLPLLPTAAGAKPAHKAPVSHDWARTVSVTPEGGFRMGNPTAKVKLVEYGSLACPHCRHFEETGYKPLVDKYVRTGAVSYEFRNLLLNAPDISVSLLTRCAGAAKFFPMAAAVFQTQPEWEGKVQKAVAGFSDAQKAEMDKLTNQQQVVRYAELGGLIELAGRFGVTPAKAHQCLSDPKALQRLLDMTEKANKAGINHTPTFIIDGKVTDASTWEELEPLIRQASGRG